MLAVCIQHEMDHLIGKMFVDYLSPAEARTPVGPAQEKAATRGLMPVPLHYGWGSPEHRRSPQLR